MDHEKDAFYVVKKRDIVGVYKCLNDCQALLGSSVCDPSVSVFKGYGLPKEAEDYLVSNGLKNAVYSVAATAVQDHLFGELSVCPFQEPSSSKRKALDQFIPNKRLQLQHKAVVPTSIPVTPQNKHVDFQKCIYIPSVFCSALLCCGLVGCGLVLKRNEANSALCFMFSQFFKNYGLYAYTYIKGSVGDWNIAETTVFCNLEFDGASRGNPGQSGAGAVLRIEVESGTRVYRLREGVGFATNSVAEYRGLLLGLKYALQKGYKYIGVQGDSQLVVTQVQGLLGVKQNMADLYNMVKELKDKFSSFEIHHVERDLNSAADVQAKLAIDLKDGDFQVEYETI